MPQNLPEGRNRATTAPTSGGAAGIRLALVAAAMVTGCALSGWWQAVSELADSQNANAGLIEQLNRSPAIAADPVADNKNIVARLNECARELAIRPPIQEITAASPQKSKKLKARFLHRHLAP